MRWQADFERATRSSFGYRSSVRFQAIKGCGSLTESTGEAKLLRSSRWKRDGGGRSVRGSCIVLIFLWFVMVYVFPTGNSEKMFFQLVTGNSEMGCGFGGDELWESKQ